MGKFANDALPHLTAAVKDANTDVRRSAILGLCAADKQAKTVLPVLTPLLQDPDHGVRQQVLSGAYRLGHDALPLYMAALKDKEPSVRWVAASWMGQFPRGGQPLRDALIAAASSDPDGTVRHYATERLAGLGEDVIPALTELAKHDDLLVFQSAMQGLQRYGAKSKGAVPVLIEVLKGGKGDARWLAAQTLGVIGPDARDALDALKEAARDPNATLQSQATQAIARIEKK
jgi:HEAT repeat protein